VGKPLAYRYDGWPLKRIAAEAGLDVIVLCDFLEGTRTLRSDVLDRLAQAVAATIQVEPTPAQRTESRKGGRQTGKRRPR
jgi:hypothetical protein